LTLAREARLGLLMITLSKCGRKGLLIYHAYESHGLVACCVFDVCEPFEVSSLG